MILDGDVMRARVASIPPQVGRLVTVLAGTALILTADRCAGGGDWAAEGRIERDWAMFMPTRAGAEYPPGISEEITDAARRDDGRITMGRYPVVCVTDAWELMSLLEITHPGSSTTTSRLWMVGVSR